jgi:hypothetical protein
MTTLIIKNCAFCDKEVEINNRTVSPYNGFHVEVGYSSSGHGWNGSRQDFIPPTDYEICDECFSQAKQAALRFRNELMKIKNSVKHKHYGSKTH